jgi:hypothetical protein
VQATSKQNFVNALEFAKSERRRNEPERDRLLVYLRAHRRHGDVDLLPLARAQ